MTEKYCRKELFLNHSIPLFTKECGKGFVNETIGNLKRKVDVNRLIAREDGIYITETDETISWQNENHFNYGGLIYRFTGLTPGTYHISVTLAKDSDAAVVSISGMNGRRLLEDGHWDAARKIPKTAVATIKDKVWEFDFVTGRDLIEVEVEPDLCTLCCPSNITSTVGIKEITLTKKEISAPNAKPTVYLLGDSTVKSYIFEEGIMSGWGQVIGDFFDGEKLKIVNYSMGGRSLTSMYQEGRLNEVLLQATPGDYLLLQSGHNDESTGDSMGPFARFGRGNTGVGYENWLREEYLPAIRSRGIHLVLITPMTRINKLATGEEVEFSGFKNSEIPGIDFPAIMKRVANEFNIPLIDLYEESMKYLKEIGREAAFAMFLSVEPGETPGKTNSGSYANGNPSGAIDGTHCKETLSKQWARIIVSQIQKLELPIKEALKEEVRNAIETGDWFSVLPELSLDVLTGENAYYREQIECLLKHHVLEHTRKNYFSPKEEMKTKDFINGITNIWELPEGFGANYEGFVLTREVMAAILYDAYLIKFGKEEDGRWRKPKYMTDYNGKALSPEDPNYDPNLIGESAQYYPLVPFQAILDLNSIDASYFEKFHTVYELGLLRSEEGIRRGVMKNGVYLRPKQVVTREKAAKVLYFLRILSKDIYEETNN